MKKSVLLLLMIFCLLACKSRQQVLVETGYRELKGEELRTMISGNTEQSSTGSYYYHAANGTFSGFSGQSGNYNVGTWKINEEGRICRVWSNNMWVPPGCSILYINDTTKDIQWLDTDGKWYGTKFHPGKVTK